MQSKTLSFYIKTSGAQAVNSITPRSLDLATVVDPIGFGDRVSGAFYTWTPPAGAYELTGNVGILATAPVTGGTTTVTLYKNGVTESQWTIGKFEGMGVNLPFHFYAVVNGTDYIMLLVTCTAACGTIYIEGTETKMFVRTLGS